MELKSNKRRAINLTENALRILNSRYLKRDERGEVLESPEEMFLRVACAVAAAEQEKEHWAEAYYDMMAGLDFLPNSPCLMNAGRELGQLAACFVLPIEDSMESIFDTLKDAALIHKSGGGTGFSFSRLRPRNSIVGSTHGISSGPVSFIKVYDSATEEIKQGGTRRGANMGMLRVDHPDILEFITCKAEEGRLDNFNISVAITDEFMEALFNDGDYSLVDPHTGEATRSLNAVEVFNLLAEHAWLNGEPGVIFIDTVNRCHPLEGLIESTNPCGEQPLLPYESCNLGSVNLSNFVKDSNLDWVRLEGVVRKGVRFLDDVIDVNGYPLEEIKEATLRNRKIGLGVMGFADMLLRLKVRYDSEEGLQWAQRVMNFIADAAADQSEKLGVEKGSFPAIPASVYKGRPMRNACRTTIAPTGTIARIAGTSSGIEPNFSWKTVSLILDTAMTDYHPLAEPYLEQEEPLPGHFVTATEISPEWHIRMQAAFQKHVDAAVSKTINFAGGASREDVAEAFVLAYNAGLKGLTVYREGSRRREVLVKEEAILREGRPDKVTGYTYKMNTGMGNLYVTINEIDGKPFELFAILGKSGQSVTAKTEAIGRLVSVALQHGVSMEKLIHQLGGISGSSQIMHQGGSVLSIPDAIAKVMTRYLKENTGKEPELSALKEICPECGGQLEVSEGCFFCKGCFFSRC